MILASWSVTGCGKAGSCKGEKWAAASRPLSSRRKRRTSRRSSLSTCKAGTSAERCGSALVLHVMGSTLLVVRSRFSTTSADGTERNTRSTVRHTSQQRTSNELGGPAPFPGRYGECPVDGEGETLTGAALLELRLLPRIQVRRGECLRPPCPLFRLCRSPGPAVMTFVSPPARAKTAVMASLKHRGWWWIT